MCRGFHRRFSTVPAGNALSKLAVRERTLASLGPATGLRVNELLALGWGDVNRENLGASRDAFDLASGPGNWKADASAKPVPMDSHMAEDLLRWRRQSIYASDDDYVFASETTRGKQPFWPDNLMKREIRPVAKANGIHEKIGWHTSRHSFVTLLKANGEDVKTVQELLRHANSKSTLDVYTHAVKPFPPRSD
jgi:integrase